MASLENPKVYLHVQYLRAVAALMVVFQHAQFVHHPNWGGVFGGLDQFGGLGVDLFFCISGFVIFATTLHGFSLRDYLVKRCIRIIPIYWLLTCVMAALVLGAPQLFKSTVFTLDHFVRSLLFIPTYTPSRPNEITPLLPPGWTLNFEMFFYLTFGVLLFLLRSRLAVVGALAVLFGMLVFYGSVMGSDNALLLSYTSPRILEFLAGVLAAYLLLCSPFVVARPGAAWLLMAAGWIVILYVGLLKGSPAVLPVAVFLVVYSAAALDKIGAGRARPVFKLLGDASYSIYLAHDFVLGAAKQVTLRLVTISDSPLQVSIFMSTCMVLSALTGVCIYLWFEVPVLAWLRKALLAPPPRPVLEQGQV